MGKGRGIHLRLPVKTLEEKHHRCTAKMEEQYAQKTEVQLQISSSQTSVKSAVPTLTACQMAGASNSIYCFHI